MNPTGTDLLDIFNSRPKRGSNPARATTRSRESHGGSSGGPPGRGRLLLGGTVVVLLLALSFTAGVGVGRARRVPTGPALVAPGPSAPRESWGMRSKALPKLTAKADSLQGRSLADLYRRWPDLQGRIYVSEVLDKSQKPTGQFRLLIKDYETRDEALAQLSDLALWQIDGFMPFDNCRPERMK